MPRRRNPYALPTLPIGSYLRPERRRRRRRRPGPLESLLRAWLRSQPDDTATEAAIRARQARE